MSSILSSSSSSSSSLTSSVSFSTLSDPLSSSKTSISKDKEIAELFATHAPKNILNALHSKGFTQINECRCIPQFSRQKDEPEGNPDVRELIEKELPDLVSKKITQKEEPLTVCSVASGPVFEDLVMLSKLHEKGFKNISWILVDPCYTHGTSSLSKDEGGELLAQFKELAEYISPGIKTQTLDSTTDIPSAKLIGQPDVYLDFDDGLMGQRTAKGYRAMLEPFEKYVYSSSKPVIYLHSEKQLVGFTLDKQRQSLMEDVNAEVTLSYISPDKETPEKQTLVDSTVPAHEHTPDVMSFNYFIQRDDYDAVKFCVEKGMNPEKRDRSNYTVLMTAAERGSLNAMKALVEIGHANVNATGHLGMSALHCVTSCSRSASEVISYLVAQGASLNHVNAMGMTPLTMAVGQGNSRAIRALVSLGARIDCVDRYGYTALKIFEGILAQHPTMYDTQTIEELRALLTPKPVSTESLLSSTL